MVRKNDEAGRGRPALITKLENWPTERSEPIPSFSVRMLFSHAAMMMCGFLLVLRPTGLWSACAST